MTPLRPNELDPVRLIRHLPPPKMIPEEFFDEKNEWRKMVAIWFHEGLHDPSFLGAWSAVVRPAVNHIEALFKCPDIAHQHKLAAAAYMASQWFSKVEFYFEGQRRLVGNG